VANSSDPPANKFLIIPVDEWWWNMQIGTYPTLIMAIFWLKLEPVIHKSYGYHITIQLLLHP
jgi:hypothetical protein